MYSKSFLRIALTLALSLFGFLAVYAENASGAVFKWKPFNILVVVIICIIAAVMLYLWRVTDMLVKNYRNDLIKLQGLEPDKEPERKTLWEIIQQKAWNIVPIEDEKNVLLDHGYDGIKELDNRLPPWWLYMFYLTIIWGVGYLYVYHFSDIGQSTHEVYAAEVSEAEYERIIFLEKQANLVNESNVVALDGDSDLAEGKKLYLSSCASCHGQLGEGGVGPNMTDKHWIHGGGISNVFKTIKYGVPDKGMIAWQDQMQPAAMQKIASYILTLEGTNPPKGKAPQGEIWTGE